MELFTIQDLRNRTEDLIRQAEAGQLLVVTKNGQPLFVAVPFDEALLKSGVRLSLAVHLFADGKLGLAQAARLAGISPSEMMDKLGEEKIPIAKYSKDELRDE